MQNFTTYTFKKILAFFLAFIALHNIQGQNENRLVHPLFTDEFIFYDLLPDGTIRILAISDQNNSYGGRHPIYMDIQAGSLLELAEPISLEIPGLWFNNYVWDLCAIALKDGDLIIGNTQFDCDYDPPGGLMRLDRDGNIKWHIDFIEEEIYASPRAMVFIDANSIRVKDFWNGDDGIIIDREGNILTKSLPDTIYDFTMETDFGFLAGMTHRLDVMDTNFVVSISFELAGHIEKILALGQHKYLLQAGNKSYVFNDPDILGTIPLSVAQYQIIGYTDFIWAIQGSNKIIRLDTAFNPLDTFVLSPGIEPVICLPLDDGKIVCVGHYHNTNSWGTLLFKADEEEINFSLPQDIGITGISVNDTIMAHPYQNYHWGIDFTIDSIWLDVTNFGPDTVTKFTISSPERWSCFWCNDYSPVWNIDSLVIAPGETSHFFLGSYYSDCLEIGGSSWTICFSTVAPNEKADGNFLNDTICHRFSMLITGSENVLPDLSVRIRPNPAGDFIYIECDKGIDEKRFGSIYDVTGNRVQNFEFKSQMEKIPVTDFASGLYFVVIYNSKGTVTTKKILVQH